LQFSSLSPLRPAALFKITRDSSIYMAGCSTLLGVSKGFRAVWIFFPPQTLSIPGVYSSIPMKTIKKVMFGAVLFCSASVGFAILPPDASPSGATDNASIYRKDFVWNSVRKAKEAQNQNAAENPTYSIAHPRFVPTEPRRNIHFVPTNPRQTITFVPTTPRAS
jgi:hypothetical protein